MTDSPATLRDVFELPEPNAPEASSAEWKNFQEKIIKEVKGVKLASMPDITKKFGELFDIPIPDIFLASWTKAEAIQKVLEESRKSPETVMDIELGEHTIVSQHKPCIEVKIQNAVVKKLEFTLRLGFVLKGFNLKIKNGAVREIQTGLCQAKGTVAYGELVIAEKKLEPIALPLSIKLSQDEPEPEEQEVVAADESAPLPEDEPS
ncbi:MAG TPA: hypothetical protein VGO73_10830 [Pyrinomonadaceae bacterium]|jgi:hypothetical protein|nr:hypothetical protein [Pyrinomonadaceae bacterium]